MEAHEEPESINWLEFSSRPHVATSLAGPVFHPAQPQFQPRSQTVGQGFSTPRRQVIQHPNNLQTPAARI
jgi:hypothetical protein